MTSGHADTYDNDELEMWLSQAARHRGSLGRIHYLSHQIPAAVGEVRKGALTCLPYLWRRAEDGCMESADEGPLEWRVTDYSQEMADGVSLSHACRGIHNCRRNADRTRPDVLRDHAFIDGAPLRGIDDNA
jgi:hypothetical protein